MRSQLLCVWELSMCTCWGGISLWNLRSLISDNAGAVLMLLLCRCWDNMQSTTNGIFNVFQLERDSHPTNHFYWWSLAPEVELSRFIPFGGDKYKVQQTRLRITLQLLLLEPCLNVLVVLFKINTGWGVIFKGQVQTTISPLMKLQWRDDATC